MLDTLNFTGSENQLPFDFSYGVAFLVNFLLIFFFNRKLFFEGGFPKEQENQTKTELNEIIQC